MAEESIEPAESAENGDPTSKLFEKPIEIETEAFKGKAIAMYKMPAKQVMDVLTTQGPFQMLKMTSMLQNALIDVEQADYFEVLSFEELVEVIEQWIAKSTPLDEDEQGGSGKGSGDLNGFFK